MEKVKTTSMRSGMLIQQGGKLWRILKCEHVHVGGRGGAYMQVEMKNIEDGTKTNSRFRTEEMVERPFVETRRMTFLYADGDGYVFMDTENFEQLTLTEEFLDQQAAFLIPDLEIGLSLHEGRPIGIELPTSVVYEVTDTEPSIKGATVSGSFKPATLENGMSVMVPQFVGTGERIKVSTETGEYIQREN